MKTGIKTKQKVDYKIMSEIKCSKCKMPLKQNVVSRNQHAKLCYVCFKVSQGKFKSTEHKVINGEKIEVKKVDFLKLQKENINKYKY